MDQPDEVCLVSFAEMKAPDHLATHPFGQIPTYGRFSIAVREFEIGLIVFHLAQHAGLLPKDRDARARDHLDFCRT